MHRTAESCTNVTKVPKCDQPFYLLHGLSVLDPVLPGTDHSSCLVCVCQHHGLEVSGYLAVADGVTDYFHLCG